MHQGWTTNSKLPLEILQDDYFEFLQDIWENFNDTQWIKICPLIQRKHTFSFHNDALYIYDNEIKTAQVNLEYKQKIILNNLLPPFKARYVFDYCGGGRGEIIIEESSNTNYADFRIVNLFGSLNRKIIIFFTEEFFQNN